MKTIFNIVIISLVLISFSHADSIWVEIEYPMPLMFIAESSIAFSTPCVNDTITIRFPEEQELDTISYFVTFPCLSQSCDFTEPVIRFRIYSGSNISFQKFPVLELPLPLYTYNSRYDTSDCYVVASWEATYGPNWCNRSDTVYWNGSCGKGQWSLKRCIGEQINGCRLDSPSLGLPAPPHGGPCDNAVLYREPGDEYWILDIGYCYAGPEGEYCGIPEGAPILPDPHPEQYYIPPICDTTGYWTGMTFIYDIITHGKQWRVLPHIITENFVPDDTITISETLRVDCYSVGTAGVAVRDSMYISTGAEFKHYYFLLDSSSAWLTLEWEGGSDTVYYGDPGTFWFHPDDLPPPWRRFGIGVDSTRLPDDYTGEVTVCLQDVTNAPVIAYGEPIHLQPEGVSSFMECDGISNCCPAPAEPVCWSFTVITDAMPEETQPTANLLDFQLNVYNIKYSKTMINYSCPAAASLIIYNILGNKVFKKEIQGTGEFQFTNENRPSGIYFVCLQGEKKSIVKKIMLIR